MGKYWSDEQEARARLGQALSLDPQRPMPPELVRRLAALYGVDLADPRWDCAPARNALYGAADRDSLDGYLRSLRGAERAYGTAFAEYKQAGDPDAEPPLPDEPPYRLGLGRAAAIRGQIKSRLAAQAAARL